MPCAVQLQPRLPINPICGLGVESLKLLSFQVGDDTRYFERNGFVAHVGLALRVILGASITYVELRS